MKPKRERKIPKRLRGPYPPGSIADFMMQHHDWLLERNFSLQTVVGKVRSIGYFIAWCDGRGVTSLDQITTPLIERYQKFLYHYRNERSGEALSFANQSQRISHLKIFFSWCVRKRVMLYNPAAEIELPRSEKRLPKYVMTQEEAELVMGTVDLNEEDGTGIRDRAMLETLYSTGIRRLELMNLKIYDLDSDRGTLMVRQGKGRRDRVVPIGERAMKWIHKYLNEVRTRHVVEPDPCNLFITVKGEQIHEDYVTSVVKAYVDKSGIGKKGSCHLFRHTMATLLLENGADLRFIQAMLGHSNINATQVYTHVGIKRLKEIHDALHPGARLERRPREHNAEQFLEGILRKNESDRWEIEERELTSGSVLELQIGTQWIRGRIEHDGQKYIFLAGDQETLITLIGGTRARVPR